MMDFLGSCLWYSLLALWAALLIAFPGRLLYTIVKYYVFGDKQAGRCWNASGSVYWGD